MLLQLTLLHCVLLPPLVWCKCVMQGGHTSLTGGDSSCSAAGGASSGGQLQSCVWSVLFMLERPAASCAELIVSTALSLSLSFYGTVYYSLFLRALSTFSSTVSWLVGLCACWPRPAQHTSLLMHPKGLWLPPASDVGSMTVMLVQNGVGPWCSVAVQPSVQPSS